MSRTVLLRIPHNMCFRCCVCLSEDNVYHSGMMCVGAVQPRILMMPQHSGEGRMYKGTGDAASSL